MKIWQIALVSTTLGFGLPALAQIAAHNEVRAEVETRIRERLGKMDANHDGVITRDEMKAFADARMAEHADKEFAAMDTDKNGSVSRAEFDAFRASHGMRFADRGMMPPPPPGAPNAPPPPPPPGPDGKHGMRRMGMVMHDGPGGPGAPRMMMMARMGGDGRIVIADVVKKALERFDAIDTNKDGTISPEERKAARAKWREGKASPAL